MKLVDSAQYLISFSYHKNDNDTWNDLAPVLQSLSSSTECPDGVDHDVFESFFHKVLHEECGLIITYQSDLIPDLIVFDYDDDEESEIEGRNQYVFGFGFDGGSGATDEKMVQVFQKVIAPLIQIHLPGVSIKSEVKTHTWVKESFENTLSFQ